MPIKGLTDKPVSFPEIGHIRKGEKVEKNGKEMPRDLDYFRVVFEEGYDDAAELFFEKYGGQPRDIDILLPFNDVDRVFDSWRELYTASALLHRCDGEFVQYELNTQSGQPSVIDGLHVETGREVRCDIQNMPIAQRCKPTGRLKVIVPALKRLAYMTVHTTSIHDNRNLAAQLYGLQELTDGQLKGIPLVLRRRPREISTPSGKNGGRARREKWLLSIEANPRWAAAKFEALEAATFPVLPAVIEVDDDDEVVEIVPEVAEGNGNGDGQVEIVTGADGINADSLLAMVNDGLPADYKFPDVYRLRDAIRKQTNNPRWNWLAPNDTEGWQEALVVAQAYKSQQADTAAEDN
jgi:hypothetical protein